MRSAEWAAWIGNRIGKPPGFERVARWFAPPEKCGGLPELCLARDGFVFLARRGMPVEWHVSFFGSYEPEIRAIFRAVLPMGGVALDIGANVGWHTLLMASLVGSGGRVLAAEANPSVRQRLQDNLNLNRFKQVEVVPYAMADTEGMMEFYAPEGDDPDSGNGYVVTPGRAARTGTVRVESRRMDSIIRSSGIDRLDVIKIDVEGFEWPVLRGGEETIARFRPHVVFEYNTVYASRGGGTPKLMAEFFRTHRYRLFAIGRNWNEAIGGDHWPDCADIWAVPIG
jgi:FkbM family methyltransferase